MKSFFTFVIFFSLSSQSYAVTSMDGVWVRDGVRTCLNGEIIDDSPMGGLSNYAMTVNGENLNINFQFTYQGNVNQVNIDYSLTALAVEKNNFYEAAPNLEQHGASPLQLITEDHRITALFEDNNGNFCNGGYIVQKMIKK